jgi:hypothetical protein
MFWRFGVVMPYFKGDEKLRQSRKFRKLINAFGDKKELEKFFNISHSYFKGLVCGSFRPSAKLLLKLEDIIGDKVDIKKLYPEFFK